jgi:HK97 family phage prohead protease
MEHKEYFYFSEFEPISIVTKGEKKYTIEGYISTTSQDLANDVVTKAAQEDMLQQILGREVPITFDIEHEIFYEEGKQKRKPASNIPVAKVVDAWMDDKGVKVKAELNEDAPRFKNVWGSILKGFLHSFSVAFYPVESVTKRVNGLMTSYINKLKLVNITLTGSPVNPEANFVPVMKSVLADITSVNEVMENTEGEIIMSEIETQTDTTNVEVTQPEVKAEPIVEQTKEEPTIDLKAFLTDITNKNEELIKENVELKAKHESMEVLMKALAEKIEKLESQPVIKGLAQAMPEMTEEKQTQGAISFIK